MGADDVRELIEREQAHLREQVERLTAVFDGIVESAELVATDDEHDPEGHTIAYERQQVAALIRDARQRLDELADAQARIDAGTYGRCTSCGSPIGAERLAALPGTGTCIACAP